MATRRAPNRLFRRGAKAGRYKIKRYLGGGGFGETYKAKDPNFGTVALKFVKDGDAIDEAKRLRQVKSKFVPEVYLVIEDDEDVALPYIVMEYVHGKTLEDFLYTYGPFAARTWWRTLRPLLMALDFIHSTKLIHRDIKPANILLRGGNPTEPVLIDLGASRQQTNLEPTQIGTRGYVHPDVLGGGSDDPRRDIAALAVVSYEAIHGYGESDTWNAMKKVMQTAQDPLERAIGLGFASLADVPESVAEWLARIVESVLPTDGDPAESWSASGERSSVESSVSLSLQTSNLDVASTGQLDVQSALEILEERYALPTGCLALMHNKTDRVQGSQNLYAYRQTQQEMPQAVADSEPISSLTEYVRTELGLPNRGNVKCVRPNGERYHGATLVRTMREDYAESAGGASDKVTQDT